MKKQKKEDEEIVSAGDSEELGEDYIDSKNKLREGGAISQDLINDPFFAQQDAENETAEEKRLRMTKKLIRKLDEEQGSKEKEDFFHNL